MPEYTCPDPITVEVTLLSGSLELTAEPRDTAVVEVTPYDDTSASQEAAQQTRVELAGDTLVIAAPEISGWALRWRSPRIRVIARVPAGSDGRLRVVNADTACRGEWGNLDLNTASGNVELAQASGDVRVHTASGNLSIQRVGGQLAAKTASGHLLIQHATGPVDIKSASGRIQIDQAGGDVTAKTASGDVQIGAARTGSVRAKTVSGRVSVGVPTGTGVWLDLNSLTGHTHTDLDMGESEPATHQLNVQARTVSGGIEVRRVTLPTAPAVD